MSTIYEKLVDQAEAMVNIINKKYVAGNKMAYLALLSGVGSCRIESYPGAGHNYQAVVDAIHNCYARDNESKIDSIAKLYGYEIVDERLMSTKSIYTFKIISK